MRITIPDTGIWWLNLALGVGAVFGVLGLLIWTCQWAMHDAAQRGKSGCLIGLLVFFTWPWGLLFWLVARPEGIFLPRPLKPTNIPPPSMPCLHPACLETAQRKGKILGRATYACAAGHEFTVPIL